MPVLTDLSTAKTKDPIQLQLWKNPQYRKKWTKSHKKAMANPQFKQLQSQLSKARWKDPVYVRKLFLSRTRKGIQGFTSQGQEWLYTVITQHYKDAIYNGHIQGRLPDIIIESEALIIEYDGYYWHRKRYNKTKTDLEAIQTYLQQGYRVLRFLIYGKETYNETLYLQEIRKFLKSKKSYALIRVNQPQISQQQKKKRQLSFSL